ncbi:MAG: hypothetical protein K2K35_08085, partial [Lachnospiraceae bacterium]|nr:hypothetical protein [Lachnospiraceae bacterium]
ISYGYSLKPYYRALYYFYDFDTEKADKAFHKFIRTPGDLNSDCSACERIAQIKHSLDKDNLPEALKMSGSIENFSLRCINSYWDAWMRAKILFLNYYMGKAMFREASGIADIILSRINERPEFQVWDLIINCYAHTDPGRALRLYKKYQKKFEGSWRCPWAAFDTYKNICCFWKTQKNSGKETVKLGIGAVYKVDGLYKRYYKQADSIARKFDIRNHTDTYSIMLKDALAVADTV